MLIKASQLVHKVREEGITIACLFLSILTRWTEEGVTHHRLSSRYQCLTSQGMRRTVPGVRARLDVRTCLRNCVCGTEVSHVCFAREDGHVTLLATILVSLSCYCLLHIPGFSLTFNPCIVFTLFMLFLHAQVGQMSLDVIVSWEFKMTDSQKSSQSRNGM